MREFKSGKVFVAGESKKSKKTEWQRVTLCSTQEYFEKHPKENPISLVQKVLNGLGVEQCIVIEQKHLDLWGDPDFIFDAFVKINVSTEKFQDFFDKLWGF
jgi:hypothetical protein